MLVLDNVEVPDILQDAHFTQHTHEPLLVVTHGNLLDSIVAQCDIVENVLAQEHGTTIAPSQLFALTKEATVVAVVEGSLREMLVGGACCWRVWCVAVVAATVVVVVIVVIVVFVVVVVIVIIVSVIFATSLG